MFFPQIYVSVVSVSVLPTGTPPLFSNADVSGVIWMVDPLQPSSESDVVVFVAGMSVSATAVLSGCLCVSVYQQKIPFLM